MGNLIDGMSWAWLISMTVIVAVFGLVYRVQGSRRAVAAGVMLSMLVPEWVRWNITDEIFLNARVTIGAIGLILYLFHPLSTLNFKLNWCDFAILGMFGTHIVSDTLAGGFNAGIILRGYGEWMLPYIAGRVAIQEIGDARWLLPMAVFVTLVLTIFGLFEMFMPDRNVFEYLVNQQRPYDDRAPYNMFRMGLQRAYGTTNHPMYFGTLLFLLYPWMCYAAARAEKKRAPAFWRAMPYVCVLGVFTAISRSPLLAVPIAFYAMQLIQYPGRRIFWLAGGLLLAAALYFSWDKVYYAMETISREANSDKQVLIHNKEYRYTGTSHRYLLFVAYGPALQRAGLLGYGTEKCDTFPPNVYGTDKIPVELIAVDNAYLLFALRFGLFGSLLFSCLGASALWSYLQLAWRPKTEGSMWLVAMAGMMVAMMFVFFTVWMPPEIGFLYLFSVGAAAGLWAEQEQPMIAEKELAAKAARSKPEHRTRRRRTRHRHRSETEMNNDDGDYDSYESEENAANEKEESRAPAESDTPEMPTEEPGTPLTTPLKETKHGSGRRARERRSRE
jgi:O-Antigen ligase